MQGDPDDERERERARIQRMHFASCVEEMFDEYAPTFEKSLVQDLHYNVYNDLPRLIEDVLQTTGQPFSTKLAVDLGCGTGLAGAALRSRCTGRLVGCDLSKKMIAVAKKKDKVYDVLEACDAIAFLHRRLNGCGRQADLIVAADVLVYMRDLTDLFEEVFAALRPGGLFAFSTEKAQPEEVGGVPPHGKGWVERPSERIAHSEEYLRWLAERQGHRGTDLGGSISDEPQLRLRVSHMSETIVRRDSGRGLPGNLVVMVKS